VNHHSGKWGTHAGDALVKPLLDKQLKAASPLVLPPQPSVANVSLEVALDIVRDAFTVAGERDIYTGDNVDIWVIKREGIEKHLFELKRD
jgi:20S proteasome subunit beta 6